MRLLQEQQLQMQLDEARRRQAAQQDAAARRDTYLASIAGPGDGVGPTMPLDPAAALRAGLSAEEQKLFNPQQQRKVKSIETLAGPNGQPVPVAVYEDGSTAILPFGAKPETVKLEPQPSAVREYEYAKAQGYPGTFQQFVTEMKRAGATSVEVKYGAPVVGQDAQGNPVFWQPNPRGGDPVIVPGVKPPPTKASEMTDAQAKANLFGTRAKESDKVLQELESKGVERPGNIKQLAESVPLLGRAAGTALNWTQSAEQQKVEQAQRDFVNAVLRRESGAVISPDEFNNARIQYFPQIGDSKEVRKQKARNREIAIQGILAEVPKASRGTLEAPAQENDPLGIRGK